MPKTPKKFQILELCAAIRRGCVSRGTRRRAGVDADKLLAETRVILYERRYALAAARAGGRTRKTRARNRRARHRRRAIERAISPATRARWVEQLFESRVDGMTRLEFLQEPPGSLGPNSITRESDKVRTLLEMNIADMPDLPGTERYSGVLDSVHRSSSFAVIHVATYRLRRKNTCRVRLLRMPHDCHMAYWQFAFHEQRVLHSAHRLRHFRVIATGDGGCEATSAS
jgi:hypothetical protein